MTTGEDGGFLSRWSRRKEAAQRGAEPAEPEAAVATAPAEDPVAAAAASVDERSEVEILAALGLPDPDTLGPGADFRAFLASSVPQAIRNRALRVLWRSDPRLANLDGLVDHGEDFSDKATVKAGMRTAYEVGRGMLRAVAEPAPEPLPAATPEAAPVPPEPSAAAEARPVEQEVTAEAVTETHQPPADAAPAAQPRRMAFVLPGDGSAGAERLE